jgi:two-component system OmpR family sensor kinase/two-component system sensor histidine kinase QseC
MMNTLHTLRGRLSLSLFFSALLAAAILGVFTYERTLSENEALFDYQLRQTALSLRDQGFVQDMPFGLDGNSEVRDVLVQIWTMNGTILYLSHPGSALPDRATLGFSNVDAANSHWRVYTMIANNRVIQVAQPQEIRRDLATAAALRSLSPLLIFAPVMALLIWWLVGRGLKPVKHLEHEVTQRHAGTLDPVSERGLPGEIAPVAHALNLLLARLKSAFSAQSMFVADAAHELRSPLTALKLQLHLLENAADEQAKREALAKLNHGVDRATHLIEQLLIAARTEATGAAHAMQPENLAEITRRAIAGIFPSAQSRQIKLDVEAPDRLEIVGNSEGLQILMRNLLDNAVRYTPQGGMIRIKASAGDGKATIIVDDSGPGIAEPDRHRVFERFVRGTANGQNEKKGSGLGLAIVKNIVDLHHATIELADSPLGGLRVSLTFDTASLSLG